MPFVTQPSIEVYLDGNEITNIKNVEISTDIGFKTDIKIETNQEEKEEMNINEFKFEIGDVFVAEDNIDNVFFGTAIIVCPGFSIDDDVTINDGVNCINVIFYGAKCPDCGEPKIQEFNFKLNPNYKVKSKSRTMRDGLLFLNVVYDIENNIGD